MAAISFVHASVAALKNALRSEFPDVKSSHLTEALAFALGYRTNAAMLAALEGPENDRPFTLLDSDKMLTRLQAFGYPRDPEFDFELMDITNMPGVISTTCDHAHEYDYKSEREKAWRNLMVCAVNAGLAQKLFTLRPNDNRFGAGQIFDFTLPDGTPARGFVSDAGFSELNLHAAVNPKGDSVRGTNAGFNAGEAFASSWLERERGAWLQTSLTSFRCRKPLIQRLSALEVTPQGYGDRGRVIM